MGVARREQGQTESARAQGEAEQQDNPERSEREKKTPAQEFERSEADGSTEFTGTTKEGRRTLYWRTKSGAGQWRAVFIPYAEQPPHCCSESLSIAEM